jgi:phosphate transport system ATP-binding protein
MHPVLSVQHLSVRFDRRTIINDVSLDIPERGISVLVGRSGSGKTTFLRALNRLNEELAPCQVSGRVLLRHRQQPAAPVDIYSLDQSELPALRRTVGMVFQSPNVLPVSIRRNITLPLALVAQCPRDALEDRLEQALTTCALWAEVKDRLDSPASSLSGGQQQRLCLARALALQPEVLLLDEPTASLDVYATEQIENLLCNVAQTMPLVVVSHSLAQARALADRIFFFAEGKLSEPVQKHDCASHARLAALFGAA